MNKKASISLLLFVLGFGIFIFTRMSKLVPTIPIAILVAPVFILRFNRTQPRRRGNLLTFLGFILSINIGLWGLFDLGAGLSSLLFNMIRSSLLALLYSLPYLADSFIYPSLKKHGIISSLTFPVAVTAIFFLSSLEGPFDGAVQLGKFVYGPMILKQFISLFGIPALVFITSWFASALNYSWENQFSWKRSQKLVFLFCSLVLLVFLFGAIKTSSLVIPESDPVKIASIILIPEEEKEIPMAKIFKTRQVFPFEERFSKIEGLTKIAASNKAKIVSLQEFAMVINEDSVEKLKEECQRIAKENDLYFSITYAYFAKEGKGANKHLMIDDNGNIILDHTKRYLLGIGEIGEPGVFVKGPGILKSADTPYGRIGVSICREIDFPCYIRQAGKMNVDIMLSSSYEWPKNLAINLGYMRAIENGFSLVRPTYNGVSFAADFNGNILNQMDSDNTDGGIMYAEVPTKGVNTLYSRIGDVWGWVCVIALLGYIPVNMFLSSRQKKERA